MAYSKNKRRIIEDSESEDDNNDEKLDSDNTPGLAHEIPNKNVDVLSLTDADKTVMDKCKIFISQTNGKYCATAMEEAISKIKAIIQPINKNVDSWDEYQRYCIHEDKSKRDDFFARGLYHPSTHEGVSPVSEETLLLEVSALRNSSKAVKGKAIKTKALSVVFGPWWNYTLCRMLKILPHYKDGPDEELKSYTAVKLFLAMIDFIKEEKDVMKAGCLPKFKHDFGVDWIDCIMRAKLLFNHYSSKLLQNALIEAQKRVQSLGGVFDETKKERSGIYTSQVRQRQSKQGKSEVVVNSSEYNNATTRDGNREAPRTRVVPNASQDDEWGRVRDGSGPEPPKSKGCWEFRRGALSSKTSFYINGSKDHLFVVHGEHGGNNYGGGRNLGRGNYCGRGGGRGGGRFSGGRSGPRFGGGRLGNGGGRGGGDYYGPPAGIRCDHDRHGDRY